MKDSRIIEVLFPIHKLFPLVYFCELTEIKIGDLVVAQFKSTNVVGIVWSVDATIKNSNLDTQKIKYIISKTQYALPHHSIALIKWIAKYYYSNLGSVAKLVLPIDITRIYHKTKNKNYTEEVCDISKFSLYPLSTEQQLSLTTLETATKPVLIHGVTGSGKTEVYFHAIANMLIHNSKQQILILLPEVALTSQIIERFVSFFHFQPVVWHSGITPAEKNRYFRLIANGSANVIIGTRSSLALPYHNLCLIIVDEEHDASYKQDNFVLYNARDVAVLLAHMLKIRIALISATPSIESYLNCISDKYILSNIHSRYNNAPLPVVETINMLHSKEKNRLLSQTLIDAINIAASNGDQILLYLNRRGYAPLALCNACGYRISCSHCSVWMVVHKHKKILICHHCGSVAPIPIDCSCCGGSKTIIYYGFGIEKLQEEVNSTFPDLKTIVISSENMTTVAKIRESIHSIQNKDIQIIIGTQIITKGYHFPSLNLVGVIDADIGPLSGDLRANEKKFQILHQLSGRSGRESPGKVYVQTYQPNCRIIQSLVKQDFNAFITEEIKIRKDNYMPPFSKIASIIIGSTNETEGAKFATYMRYHAHNVNNLKILGATSAMIAKINNQYRFRILLISHKGFNFAQYIHTWLHKIKIPAHIRLQVDIDPYNFF